MSFKSFWGELDVPDDKIIDKEDGKKSGDEGNGGDAGGSESSGEQNPHGKTVNGDIKIQTGNFKLNSKEDEEDGSKKKQTSETSEMSEDGQEAGGSKTGEESEGKTKTKKVDEEEEEYEFSEDDVSKAYTMLEEEGILEIGEDDEFDSSPKGLGDAVAVTIKKKVDKIINSLPPEVHELYQHLRSGKPASEFTASTAQASWEDLDITEEDNQRKAMLQFLINNGSTPEEAKEEIEDLEVAGKLEDKADRAHKALVRKETKDKEAEAKVKEAKETAAIKARQDEIDGIKQEIDTLDEIAGFKLDDERKQEFKDYLFKVNPRTNKTQMQENMGNEDRRMTLAFLDYVNYNRLDMEKAVATDLTKKRKKKLSKYSDKNLKTSSGTKTVKAPEKNRNKQIKFPSIFSSGAED
jgi:hypothetical protein